MCLQILDQKLRGTSTTILTGYKLFRIQDPFSRTTSSRYTWRYFSHRGKHEVPLNRWLKAVSDTVLANGCGSKYKSGFHIYTEKSYPESIAHFIPGFEVVEVRYRRVIARGREDGGLKKVPVVVAREMYVPYKKKRS